jgi:hypothetical protein
MRMEEGMDENTKQNLHEYIEKHFSTRLDRQGQTIAGLQLMFVTLVIRLHQADVVPAQKVQDDLEQLAELFSNDPDNRVLPQMAREISQIIDVALGKASPIQRQ